MTTTNKLGPGGMIIAGIIMVVVAVVITMLQINELSLRAQAEEAREWPKVSATVIESKLTQLRGSTKANPRNWAPYVRYRYTVDGVEYTGERYRFIAPGRRGLSKIIATRNLKPYPMGKKFKVHVDPKDSTISVIRAGIPRTSFGLVFIGGGIIFGLAGIVVALIGAKKKFGPG
jgi:hypothetical protein